MSDRGKPLRAFVKAYKAAGLFLWITVSLLLLLNLVLYAVFAVRDALSPEDQATVVEEELTTEAWPQVYPGRTPVEIRALLDETWSRPQVYSPLVQFRERVYSGKYVNVSEAGFRVSEPQGPWPPDPGSYNIFMFGGSTLFCYGLSDEETIASALEAAMPTRRGRTVRVYNFGVGSFFSSQERVLFAELLARNRKPDLAVFLDGVNDLLFDEPAHTERLQELFEMANDVTGAGEDAGTPQWLQALPMTRFAHFIRRRFGDEDSSSKPAGPPPGRYEGEGTRRQIARRLERYAANKKLISAMAGESGVEAIFVWQPIPYYEYAIENHPFAERGERRGRYLGEAYTTMAAKRDDLQPGFFWAAGMQEDLKEPLYVDNLHYSARMSRLLAGEIAAYLETGTAGGPATPAPR